RTRLRRHGVLERCPRPGPRRAMPSRRSKTRTPCHSRRYGSSSPDERSIDHIRTGIEGSGDLSPFRTGPMKWQNTEQHEWLQALSARGLAWEFWRRHRAYRSAAANLGVTWPPDGSPPDETWSAGDQMSEAREWGLLLFETPDRDAREANIFWMPEFCPSVLPV